MSQSGGRAFTSGLRAPEQFLGVLASKPTSVTLRHSQRSSLGSELVTQAKVQAFASGHRYPDSPRQWLPRVPLCERNANEKFRSIAGTPPAETRTRRRLASHGEHLKSCD